MRQAIVVKPQPRSGIAPNLADYDDARRNFSWAAARGLPDGLAAGGVNIAHEAVATLDGATA